MSRSAFRFITSLDTNRLGGGGYGGGGRGRLYLSLLTLPVSHHQNDFCIKMGSDENHFNVSVAGSDGQSHRTVPTNHNLSEEKGEPKRYRGTKVLPLSTVQPTPYRALGQTSSHGLQPVLDIASADKGGALDVSRAARDRSLKFTTVLLLIISSSKLFQSMVASPGGKRVYVDSTFS